MKEWLSLPNPPLPKSQKLFSNPTFYRWHGVENTVGASSAEYTLGNALIWKKCLLSYLEMTSELSRPPRSTGWGRNRGSPSPLVLPACFRQPFPLRALHPPPPRDRDPERTPRAAAAAAAVNAVQCLLFNTSGVWHFSLSSLSWLTQWLSQKGFIRKDKSLFLIKRRSPSWRNSDYSNLQGEVPLIVCIMLHGTMAFINKLRFRFVKNWQA
jgi:hypothetical protein